MTREQDDRKGTDGSRSDPPPDPPSAVDAATLRRRAEQRLRAVASLEEPRARTIEETADLVHELRVHQIELEMQNEELRLAQEALEVSRARYFSLYDLAPVGYLTLNEAELIEEANLATASLLSTARNDLIHKPLTRFIVPPDQDTLYRCWQRLWSTEETQTCELRLRRPDEGPAPPIWVRLETSLRTESPDGRRLWLVTLSDITYLKEGERARRDALARLHLVAEIAEVTFWEWHPRTDEIAPPPGFGPRSGPGSEPGSAQAAVEGRQRLDDWLARLHPEDRERFRTDLAHFEAAGTRPHELEYRRRCRDGGYRWMVARLHPLADDHGPLDRVLLVQQDITRRKESEHCAIRLAQHDPLTGLPSRALLVEMAEHMLASARRSGDALAVLYFDLDRFKPINDVHGHAVGDKLLRALAQRLQAALRAEDLVARVGGDEFIAVLPHIHGSDDAARAARQAIKALAPAYRIEGLELHCVPSIGISLFPRDGEGIGDLIRGADRAMYQAKRVGHGQFQFMTEALNRQARLAQELEDRLRRGLAHAEFQLVYQPVLDIRDGTIVGAEALLRWPQAGDGDIAPATFLPVAEASGLIREIGHWVLREATRQQRAWCAEGLPPIPMAVNISARQLRHPAFLPEVAAAVQASGIDPAFLTLVLGGASLMQDVEAARRVLDELKQLGVRLALDDLTLSGCSLGVLKALPLDQLKIKRDLVRCLDVVGYMPAMIDAVLCLGRALQLDVTAVGIETEAELEFFRQRHCFRLQGFHLGTPMAGDEFADWLRHHSALVPSGARWGPAER
ncbi:putative bifunctional diguanylate cyclase/phosphodiesterase [Thiococcus pfennigii]|uniref:putative bifunctional diguanylate cyclase/phosphodiesterase n=1 Tax=Thiococcus pfennigii TaxID=1057 RepID=UPI001A932110|nr:EAL domain-containing protein [Thiococcus pfennigii]